MRLVFASSAALVLLSSQALAWGPDGHRMIGELAMAHLPDDMPAFLRTPDAAQLVGYLSPEADRERGAGPIFDAEHSPAHFVDVADDLTIGGVPLNALPPTREAFDSALRAAGTDEYKTGYLPLSIADGFELVVKDFAYWRVDQAGQKFAKNDTERAWYARDAALREAIVLHDIGIWSHFVGDGSQPMHASVHYDGWGDFPNPDGFTQDKVHIPFENQYVHDNMTKADVEVAMPALSLRADEILACAETYLAGTQALAVPFYRLQKSGAFDKHTQEGPIFAATQIARGAGELRDLVAKAWADSEKQSVGYPPMSIRDVESGKTDPYASLTY
jgi:hypothetical protein